MIFGIQLDWLLALPHPQLHHIQTKPSLRSKEEEELIKLDAPPSYQTLFPEHHQQQQEQVGKDQTKPVIGKPFPKDWQTSIGPKIKNHHKSFLRSSITNHRVNENHLRRDPITQLSLTNK